MQPGDDVDALLAEADAAWRDDRPCKGGDPMMVQTLARALRAERERADKCAEVTGLAYWRAFDLQAHLRAVLAYGWPEGSTGPACVRAARAFLAGEEPAQKGPPTCTFCDQSLDDQSFQGLADRRTMADAKREIDLLRKDLAEKGAALVRMQGRYEQASREREAYKADAEMERRVADDAQSGWSSAINERDEARRRVDELEAALRGLVALVPAKGGA